jgi:hypothetical protein
LGLPGQCKDDAFFHPLFEAVGLVFGMDRDRGFKVNNDLFSSGINAQRRE